MESVFVQQAGREEADEWCDAGSADDGWRNGGRDVDGGGDVDEDDDERPVKTAGMERQNGARN